MKIDIKAVKKKFEDEGHWVNEDFKILSVEEDSHGIYVYFTGNSRYWKYIKRHYEKPELVETLKDGKPKDYTLSVIYETVGYTATKDVAPFKDFPKLLHDGYVDVKSSKIIDVKFSKIGYTKEIVFQVKDRYYLAEVWLALDNSSLVIIKRVNKVIKQMECYE